MAENNELNIEKTEAEPTGEDNFEELNKRKNRPHVIESSLEFQGGRMWEQVYSEGVCRFVSPSVSINHKLDYDYVELIIVSVDGIKTVKKPIFDDAVKTQAVLLPQHPAPITSLSSFVLDIQSHIHKYLDISPQMEKFATYYILLSWQYDALNTVPYMSALGDSGCGKTRYLDVIGRLCYKPCLAAGAVNAAPLYRMMKRWHGTLVLDEADFQHSDEKADVMKILNCGFERGRPVIRCKQNNVDELQFFDAFGPKVIARRKRFYDKATESRCLTEIMQQTTRTDIPSQLPPEFFEEEMRLRNQLLTFRFNFRERINLANIQKFDTELRGVVEPRLRQGASSLAVIFAEVPEVWEDFKNFLRSYQAELIEERAGTLEGILLGAYLELRKSSTDISSGDILSSLQKDAKDVTPQKVGAIMKSLGFKPTMKRCDSGPKRVLMIEGAQLNILKARYVQNETCNDLPKHTDVTLDTNVTHGEIDKKQESVTSITSVTTPSGIAQTDNSFLNSIKSGELSGQRFQKAEFMEKLNFETPTFDDLLKNGLIGDAGVEVFII